MVVVKFTFNPFSENTYILYDNTKACIIVDPGCYDVNEQKRLVKFINDNDLKPVRLINTHCHIDHIFGNAFIAKTYGLELEAHKDSVAVLEMGAEVAKMYGLQYTPSPDIGKFLPTEGTLTFGETELELLFTPGHCPGELSFYHKETGVLIAGDVLFFQSIGRTDLPGGNHQELLDSIRTQFWKLPNETKVYCGHGQETTIGFEKENNPFLG